MHRLWFKVWPQGQAVASPAPVTSLPRGAHVSGNIAFRYGRGRVLAEAYALAADAEQAQRTWAEARAVLVPGRWSTPAPDTLWAISHRELTAVTRGEQQAYQTAAVDRIGNPIVATQPYPGLRPCCRGTAKAYSGRRQWPCPQQSCRLRRSHRVGAALHPRPGERLRLGLAREDVPGVEGEGEQTTRGVPDEAVDVGCVGTTRIRTRMREKRATRCAGKAGGGECGRHAVPAMGTDSMWWGCRRRPWDTCCRGVRKRQSLFPCEQSVSSGAGGETTITNRPRDPQEGLTDYRGAVCL